MACVIMRTMTKGYPDFMIARQKNGAVKQYCDWEQLLDAECERGHDASVLVQSVIADMGNIFVTEKVKIQSLKGIYMF